MTTSPKQKASSTTYQIEASLGFLVNRTGRMMAKRLREKFEATGFMIPVEHWAIIAHLWNRDGQQQQELADCIFKDKGTVTRAINSLEKLGLVERREGETDRRYNLIYLTKKGRKLQQELTPILLSVLEEASEGIDTVEMEVCKKVLIQIYHNLDTEIS